MYGPWAHGGGPRPGTAGPRMAAQSDGPVSKSCKVERERRGVGDHARQRTGRAKTQRATVGGGSRAEEGKSRGETEGRGWWEGATDWEAGFNPEGITGEPSGGIPVGVTWLDMHLFLCRRRENQGKAGSLIRRLMQWAGRERQRTEEVEKDSFLTLTYFFLCAIDPPPT